MFGGDDWSRTSSARRAADLQSTGVTNFPTSPNLVTLSAMLLDAVAGRMKSV